MERTYPEAALRAKVTFCLMCALIVGLGLNGVAGDSFAPAAEAVEGQADNRWIGKEVVTKLPTPMKLGKKIVRSNRTAQVYTVERADGDLLWLTDGYLAGWVKADDVIAVNEAIDFFSRQIQANASADALTRRGFVWEYKGNDKKAMMDYGEAMHLDPGYAPAYTCRGRGWFAQQKFEKSIADFDEAIQLDPKDPSSYCGRGLVWNNLMNPARAIADFDAASLLNPNDPEIFVLRGSAWLMKGDENKAIADYDEAIRLNPQVGEAYAGRGSVWLFLKKDLNRAITDFTQAIRIQPDAAGAYINRANAWTQKKDFDRAIADYEQLIPAAPVGLTRRITFAQLPISMKQLG